MVETPQNHFFALCPSAGARAALVQWQEQIGCPAGSKMLAATDLHCTLLFLGRLDIPSPATLAAIACCYRGSGFELRFDTVNYWAKPRIICASASVSSDPELGLRTYLVNQLAAVGFRHDMRAYRPHVTLFRQVKPMTLQPSFPMVSWYNDKFCLLRSPGAGENGYQVLDYWKLDQ